MAELGSFSMLLLRLSVLIYIYFSAVFILVVGENEKINYV